MVKNVSAIKGAKSKKVLGGKEQQRTKYESVESSI